MSWSFGAVNSAELQWAKIVRPQEGITTSMLSPFGWPVAVLNPESRTVKRTNSASGITENEVHVHDLQATILHQLGLDHTKLTFRFQGRDYRLTDVHGKVVKDILV